jgi:hypothetical protein
MSIARLKPFCQSLAPKRLAEPRTEQLLTTEHREIRYGLGFSVSGNFSRSKEGIRTLYFLPNHYYRLLTGNKYTGLPHQESREYPTPYLVSNVP